MSAIKGMKGGEVKMKTMIVNIDEPGERAWDGSPKTFEIKELVRCKDCEHCYFASNRIPSEQNYACGKHGFDVAPDWYCADGERK